MQQKRARQAEAPHPASPSLDKDEVVGVPSALLSHVQRVDLVACGAHQHPPAQACSAVGSSPDQIMAQSHSGKCFPSMLSPNAPGQLGLICHDYWDATQPEAPDARMLAAPAGACSLLAVPQHLHQVAHERPVERSCDQGASTPWLAMRRHGNRLSVRLPAELTWEVSVAPALQGMQAIDQQRHLHTTTVGREGRRRAGHPCHRCRHRKMSGCDACAGKNESGASISGTWLTSSAPKACPTPDIKPATTMSRSLQLPPLRDCLGCSQPLRMRSQWPFTSSPPPLSRSASQHAQHMTKQRASCPTDL